MIMHYEIILRLVLSAFVGGLIGIEREANNRPAGLRTHVLVALGASLIMLISIDGFHSLGTVSDPARLAAQVISGVGFLGAGTILRTGNSIKGLTTAASLWVCAGIGLAIGNGYYVGGMTTAIIVLFSLKILGVIEKKFFTKKDKVLILQCRERLGLIGDVGQILGSYNVVIKDIKIIRNVDNDIIYDIIEELEGEIIEIQFSLKFPKNLNLDIFFKEINAVKNVLRCFWQEERVRYSI